MMWMRRFLLRLILGRRTYRYMCQSLGQDRRLPKAYTADIVIRKDGRERRVEADWLKKLARICGPDLPPPVPDEYRHLHQDRREALGLV